MRKIIYYGVNFTYQVNRCNGPILKATWTICVSKLSIRYDTPYEAYKKGFDQNSYNLFVKVGYNTKDPSRLGKLPSISRKVLR